MESNEEIAVKHPGTKTRGSEETRARAKTIFGQALEAAKKIEDEDDRMEEIGSVLKKEISAGFFDDAMAYAKLSDNVTLKYELISAIAYEYLADNGGYEKALDLLSTFQKENKGFDDTVKEDISAIQLSEGKLDEALATARTIEDAWLLGRTLGSVAIQFAKTDNIKKAEEVISYMKEEDQPDMSATLGLIALLKAKSGDLEDALKRANAIRQEIFVPRTLSRIAAALIDPQLYP